MNRYSKALRILSPKGQIEDKSLLAVKIFKDPAYTYHESSGKRIKSPQQFFNPADVN